MIKLIKCFLREDRGVTAIEYALIAGLVAAGIATALGTLSTDIQGVFSSVASTLSANTPKSGT